MPGRLNAACASRISAPYSPKDTPPPVRYASSSFGMTLAKLTMNPPAGAR